MGRGRMKTEKQIAFEETSAESINAASECANELQRLFVSGFFENNPEVSERVKKKLDEYRVCRDKCWNAWVNAVIT